ncbi:MAG: shikimate kinase [Actinobacteria bacterium]|nr:shikimate kinase [Actinomycetota bacterium]NDD51197.1 shikimate kinase [Actinomycetota bacterium]NDF43012.1 shikimate kinase [Actinomycetota bacterium]
MLPIILIGPPGAGKTSVGKALAKKLSFNFLDSDKVIEERSGKSISEIFIADGEPAFRDLEREAVIDLLENQRGVIALGGGSVMDPAVSKKLKPMANVVFLDVSISNAAPRVGFNRDRPLLLGNPRQQWIALMEKRRSTYESLSKTRVSTDNKKPIEVAEEIVKLLAL